MITASGIESVAAILPSLTALQTLDLSFNDVGDKGAVALAAALPQSRAIHTLKLVRCKIYVIGARAFAESLSDMTHLQVECLHTLLQCWCERPLDPGWSQVQSII